ncbi:ADP-ribosylation factor-binding protein GGA3 [Planococcus citri]|uniref:ADP-ribosylation factor-binding protein GGA3 n=1 Tax=Planococcus citri TaxID=170843 RepID=UPI0031F99AF5
MSFDMDLESVLKATVLEALLEKATCAQNKHPNLDAIGAFSRIIIQEPETVATAVKMILFKMQSSVEWEAFQAIILLESCMENGSALFLGEVGKFRFLNELIKLVSPKYLGNSTPTLIKNKIIDLLKLWCVKYPNETKIKEAFEMLKKQGVLVKTSTELENGLFSSPAALMSYPRAEAFEDDEKSKTLQKLLRSNKPNDLKAANHLIKTMVKEKEDKEDMRLIANNAKLLSEMLNNITADSSSQDIELIKELKETCTNMKPTLSYLISCYSKTTRDSVELIELNDLMNDTLQLYNDKMSLLNKPSSSNTPCKIQTSSSPPTLLDFSSPIENNAQAISPSPSRAPETQMLEKDASKSTADTLEEIFNQTVWAMDNFSIKKPDVVEESRESGVSNPTKLFQDLNALGKSYLETNSSSMNSDKLNEKIESMNISCGETLVNGKINDVVDDSFSNDDKLLTDEDLAVDPNCNSNDTASIDWNVSIKDDVSPLEPKPTPSVNHIVTVEPLQDVSVPLVEIKIGSNEKQTVMLDRDGINVYIQLTDNKPREDVSVFLVMCNSQRTESISNFLFQPVISKDCRLKLQPPTKCELPPYNPYLPAETIVQIMLIAAPNKDFIPLKFVVSYNLKDEMITEMGEVEVLPLKQSYL